MCKTAYKHLLHCVVDNLCSVVWATCPVYSGPGCFSGYLNQQPITPPLICAASKLEKSTQNLANPTGC